MPRLHSRPLLGSLVRLFATCAAVCAIHSSFGQAGVTDTVGERAEGRGGAGPMHLVLNYKVKNPETRVAFREYMTKEGVQQFEAWKKAGVMENYLILFSSFYNERLYDMWIILDFAKYADVLNWYEVEKKFPGGLSAEALKLGSPKSCVYTDLPWSGGSHAPDLSKSIYMIIPYKTLVSVTKYEDYSKKYVVPQLQGWVKSGTMPSYQVHQNQNPTKAPWDILMVFEYDGIRGISLRDITKNEVRRQIKEDEDYKKYSAIKLTIREEDEPTTYVPILAR